MNPRRTSHHSVEPHSAIDHALRQLGSAQPDPGMNDRLLRRLRQAAPAEPSPRRAPSLGWPRLAAAGLAGCCLCAAVVVGSVQHSHYIAAQNQPPAPILQRHNGISTASSTHISAHPPVAPKNGGRSHHRLSPGRATVPPGTHVHGGDGVTVPPHNP